MGKVIKGYCENRLVREKRGMLGGSKGVYIYTFFRKPLNGGTVRSWQVIADSNDKDAVSMGLRGIGGWMLLGTLGGLVGAATTKAQGMLVAVEFRNGKKSLIQMEKELFAKFKFSTPGEVTTIAQYVAPAQQGGTPLDTQSPAPKKRGCLRTLIYGFLILVAMSVVYGVLNDVVRTISPEYAQRQDRERAERERQKAAEKEEKERLEAERRVQREREVAEREAQRAGERVAAEQAQVEQRKNKIAEYERYLTSAPNTQMDFTEADPAFNPIIKGRENEIQQVGTEFNRRLSGLRPKQQLAFLHVAQKAITLYKNAHNDEQRGDIQLATENMYLQILGGNSVIDWVGSVSSSEPGADTQNAPRSLVIRIHANPITSIMTSPVDFMDSDKTLINNDSPLYGIASKLQVGDLVIFSGNIEQDSLSLSKKPNYHDSIYMPSFKFHFTKLDNL